MPGCTNVTLPPSQLCPSYRCGNRGRDGVSNLTRLTELAGVRAGVLAPRGWLQGVSLSVDQQGQLSMSQGSASLERVAEC